MKHHDLEGLVERENGSHTKSKVHSVSGESSLSSPRPINIHIHDLRHASASLLLQQGWSIPAIAARLGHSPVNVAVTYRYAHVAHTAQEDIAKSLDSLARSKEESDVSEEQR